MKISLQWLEEYIGKGTTAEQAADALMNGGFPVEGIERLGDDSVLDVEVTSNRGDCLSHRGVARELSALTGEESRAVPGPELRGEDAPAQPASKSADNFKISIDAPDLCPHYVARIIRNVKIRPSPDWLQKRLLALGLRPINNVVDVTNYVMFELGQPLHAFDLDKLHGQKIIIRRAAANEKITSIDGHDRKLEPTMLVIGDADRPVALAGVMGGKDTEVSDGTTNILLESARFDPLSIRSTARALTMKSDSSYRFERGIDPLLPIEAAHRAADLIVQIASGELSPEILQDGATGYAPKKVELRLGQVERLLGVKFSQEQILNALNRQYLSPQIQNDRIVCQIPSWRLDLNIEVDLIEEIARTLGYDKIPTRSEISIRLTPPQKDLQTIDSIRTALVAAGYFEAVTFSWVADNLATDFLPREAKGLPRAEHSVRKADGQLRPSLLPGLLESVRHNETAGTANAKLFEIGSVFWLGENGVIENRQLALVGSSDYREVRGAVESLLTKLDHHKPIRIEPAASPGFASGAAGMIHWDDKPIGQIGRVDSAVISKIDLRTSPCAAQLDLATLLAGMATETKLNALPRFPAVRRDLSLVVAEKVAYQQIDSLVRSLKPEMMEDLEYITTYRGKPLEKGQKSITITLIFRSPSTTLTAEQVESSVQKVIEAANRDLGATLRT
ncbi:MAG TPA: phenylalanine--tRNA ligase subunit beta [Tepidisphaeraceae bacterium]|jgi:phenylalanyl-tRNA synthetase beta chain